MQPTKPYVHLPRGNVGDRLIVYDRQRWARTYNIWLKDEKPPPASWPHNNPHLGLVKGPRLTDHFTILFDLFIKLNNK
jgi:hypothetical protein